MPAGGMSLRVPGGGWVSPLMLPEGGVCLLVSGALGSAGMQRQEWGGWLRQGKQWVKAMDHTCI